MPLVFLVVLVVISSITGAAVIFGTDADGSKGFIATAADQQSLMAFAGNAFIIAGLFGAIAVAREYGHGTVIPTFLAWPRRHEAVLAQFFAMFLAGGVLGFVGAALTIVAVAVSLPTTDHGFLVAAADVTRVLAASTFAGAAGAVLGGGIGALLRNTGGAVAAAALILLVVPPVVAQLVTDSASWIPSTLGNVLSGSADDVSALAALAAIFAWAAIPAIVGLVSVQRRDVV